MSPASLVIAACALIAGCGLASSEGGGTHWFTPEHVTPRLTSAGLGTGPPLHLGDVTAFVDPGQRIVYGDGAYQIGFYEDRRWTEPPEAYVRRALFRALFEEQHFRPASARDAVRLDVEIPVFQELKIPGTHAARVALRITLSTDRILFEDTIVITELVTGERFADVAAAMGRALEGASREAARRLASVMVTPDRTL